MRVHLGGELLDGDVVAAAGAGAVDVGCEKRRLVGVGRLVDDAALGPERVALEGVRSRGEHGDAATAVRGLERRRTTRHARANHEKVGHPGVVWPLVVKSSISGAIVLELALNLVHENTNTRAKSDGGKEV